eukprot:CAMPEP_0203671262 /NCGR_PEP_ID=MMETSP0090-20130426/7095_1 /ASSEMBLY_ACC=CAM_ASM_001088 /TAXON_ID=426623 /ORGANISM="Chaetoceros affinis, Strain CCMP159" /LENGTH=1430 /DNA_ID=CAMNT_0050536291 /DNA_START=64 /DNA_END=4353 /DNA_ORIENTATION=+
MNNYQTRTTASITTGLLTLSVHDNLTFEGVEVALHPDLFANVEGGGNVGGGSANVSTATVPTHSRQASRDGSTSSAFAYQHQPQYHHSRDASFASYSTAQNTPLMNHNNKLLATPILLQEDGGAFISRGMTPTTTDSINNSPKKSNTLKVGDLIEIKVWEQKINHGKNTGRNNSSTTTDGISNSFNVVDRAVSKLQQHVINQSGVTNTASGSASTAFQTMYHPLAIIDQSKESSSTASARPPIAPRTLSNESSTVGPSMHTGPPPSPSPSPKSQSLPPSTPKPNILPRRSNTDGNTQDIRDRNLRHDITFDPNYLNAVKTNDGNTSSVFLGDNGNLSILENNDFKRHDNKNNDNTNKSEIFDHLKEMHSQQQHQQQIHNHQYQDVTDLISHTHVLKTKFVMSVTEQSLKALKSSGRVQISLLRQVATLYNLSSYVQVTVTKIHKSEEASVLESVKADHVTLTIKDQFISRGEMYQFQNYFLGKWIYAGERLKTNDDMRAYVMELRNGDQELKSGILTNETKITFRTRSARIFWLVQISSEMWNYASSYRENSDQNGCCEIYFDKFVSFMKRLFEEWKALDVSHSLTILFFSRTYINNAKKPSPETTEMITALTSPIKRDTDGRLYEDFYKIIAENVTKSMNWESIIFDVKKAFVRYPSEVGWRVSPGNTYSRVPSTSAEGNILEAINTALNVMQLHYIDRDLYRCGNSIVVVSAGSGVFEVDKNLAGITKQRMMDNGIGSDMLSLGLPPLHVAPFFLYKESSTPRPDESHDFDGWQNFFEIPHWMHLSFAAYHDRVKRKEKVNVENHSRPPIRIMGNGFIVREKDATIDMRGVGNDEKKNNPQTQRHLISGRDFEDILEACRPRNLDNTICGMPKALVSQMKIFGLIEKTEVNDHSVKSGFGSSRDFESSPGDSASDRSRSSFSTATSNFTNTFPAVLSRSPGSTPNQSPILSSVQIQQSRSLDLPSFLLNEIELRSKTREFDRSIFKSDGSVIHQSTRTVPEVEGVAPSPIRTQTISGIGEVINQYDNNPDLNHSAHSHLPTPQPMKSTPREPTAITRVKKALGTQNINFHQQVSSRPNSMGYLEKSMDKPNHLDVTQHTVTFPPTTTYETQITLPKSVGADDNYLMARQSKKEQRLSSSNKDASSVFSVSPKTRRSFNSTSPPSRMKLNVKPAKITNLALKTQSSQKSKNGGSTASRRKQWVLNPFKQEDEDEVLAKRNYNSRRWSHVFPQGETEFKRHAGPNFKSLCQPAILPVEIDVFPSKEELDVRYNNRFHAVNLAAIEKTFYKSHTDLLMEMVRQRLVQDYQLVLPDVYTESRKKTTRDTDGKQRKLSNFPSELSTRSKDSPRKQKDSSERNIKIALSMGHCFQTIQYQPDDDSVRVDSYSRNDARNEGANQFKNTFQLWLPASERYTAVHQRFDKYPAEYNW